MLLDIGDFTYLTPEWVNILSHTGLMLAALYLSYLTISSGERLFIVAFLMFSLGEAMYMTYHFGLTELLFVYLVGDGLVFVALTIIFAGLVRRGIIGEPRSAHRGSPPDRPSTAVRVPRDGHSPGGNS